MAEAIHDKLNRYLEGLIDDEAKTLRERARDFQPTSLLGVDHLVQSDPSDPRLPGQVLEALTPFFESGLLLQKSPAAGSDHWWGTDLFWRGNTFHLSIEDQVRATGLVPEMTPMQVHKTSADKILGAVKLPFLASAADSDAFLLRPTPTAAYLLVATLGAPWSVDHLSQAQRLINKCFIY